VITLKRRDPDRTDLKVVIKENLRTWKWEVYQRNAERNKWNRADWLRLEMGTSLTEKGAKNAAEKAIRKIRERELKLKEIVYYDPPEAALRAGRG
jgi:hypothetical protein